MPARNWILASLIVIFGATAFEINAQQSADEILEQARAKAQEIEKLKRIINEEPDQNVRLAAFDLMMKSNDPTTQEVALDAGLASADKLLQAAAFKAAIMNLERFHLTLAVDPNASDEIRERSQNYIANNGDAHVIELSKKDPKAGTFSNRSGAKGEVIGTHLTYVRGYNKGKLELVDDDTITGELTMYSSGYLKYIATGKIR